MKTQILSLLLGSLAAANASADTITRGSATIQVLSNIACVSRPGEFYTVVGDRHNLILDDQPRGMIELDHKTAQGPNCDIRKITRLEDQAKQRFGFLSVAAIVTKSHGEPFRNNKGECFARLTEKLELNLGEGVVVSSHRYADRKSNQCR